MAVRIRTRAELVSTLDNVVYRMKSAGERFDQGKLLEAKALAVQIRALLHDTEKSHALINELGLQRDLTWVDTAGVVDPKSTSAAACLTLMKIRSGRGSHATYVPKLELYPPAPIRTRDGGRIDRGSRIPFDHWWTNPVVKDCDGLMFSRRQLVLAMARHGSEDDDVQTVAAYDSLIASQSLGWVVSGENDWAPTSLESNPVMASVRQISYEVLQSIKEQRDVIDAVIAA